MSSERIDRLLSLLGHGTRSDVQRMIRTGRVRVGGAVCFDPGARVSTKDAVALDDAALDTRLFRCVMMDKPAGILTAARDRACQTVMDLLPAVYASLSCMPVGRLDKDTTGLLLLTTDGELCHRLLSPKREVEKTYRAVVEGRLTDADAEVFARGVALSDFTALPAKMTILRADDAQSEALAVVREGKYHQIKRMFGARGHEVLSLRREKIGAFDVSMVGGLFRELTDDEVSLLRQMTGMEETL